MFDVVTSDYLVLGSGVAGLIFALKVAPHGHVCILTKKENTESNTNYAQGGIAAVFASDDSFELHIQDTVRAGVGLCHKDAVEVMVWEGPALVRDLMQWGVHFAPIESGVHDSIPDLGQEGGHSRRRIVHARDRTGQRVEHVLVSEVKRHPNAVLIEDHTAIDLIVYDGECWGVWALESPTGRIRAFLAKAVFLATGGAAQVYLHTTNPPIATGDGIVMAYRAGVHIANMEFVQFHPTSLFGFMVNGRAFLISEAVRGEGGVIRNADGEAFLDQFHPQGSLAPRDVVARAIDLELKRTGSQYVFLDLSSIGPERVRTRFPHIYETCLLQGIDISSESIPVVPAAHYFCGGVLTDIDGCTSIPRLYAAGEVSCTGVHGANRLASNSLLEALVFADRAHRKAVSQMKATWGRAFPEVLPLDRGSSPSEVSEKTLSSKREQLRGIMWEDVGIVRSDERLGKAWTHIKQVKQEAEDLFMRGQLTCSSIELRNLATVGDLIVRSALMRQESRGLHYNVDHPERDDRHWQRDTVLTISQQNQ